MNKRLVKEAWLGVGRGGEPRKRALKNASLQALKIKIQKAFYLKQKIRVDI